MSDFYHGVRTKEQEAPSPTPAVALSGVPFIVGAAPVHMVGGKVNEPVLAKNYSEAASALGYCDNWANYDICEMMFSHFVTYRKGPVVFVNVLDPEKHKTTVPLATLELADRKLLLPLEALRESVEVKSAEVGDAYVEGIDFELFYAGGYLVLEALDGGGIPEAAGTLSISYDKVDPGKLTKADIIGGYDIETKTKTGFELIDLTYPKFLIAPDLLLAPNWSGDPEVAAVMAAKAESINGLFSAKALIDVNSSDIRHYSDVPAWKRDNGVTAKAQNVFWPMLTYGGRTMHMSVHAAGLMAKVDADNGDCPCESPSNKSLYASGTVLADGTEVFMDITEANALNADGILTAINSTGGYVLWGNYNACGPGSTEPKDCFIPESRMFGWIGKTVILTHWSKVDKPLNRRLIDSIVDAVNIWLNGLIAEEKLYGGRIEFQESDNLLEDFKVGKMRFRIYLASPGPAQDIEFMLEYDASYIMSALA